MKRVEVKDQLKVSKALKGIKGHYHFELGDGVIELVYDLSLEAEVQKAVAEKTPAAKKKKDAGTKLVDEAKEVLKDSE